MHSRTEQPLTTTQLSLFNRVAKRSFDVCVAILGLLVTGWLILLAAVLARIDTGLVGFFTQERVGKDGKLFKIIKIRTMKNRVGIDTSVTTISDERITKFGRFLRRTKIDELPQLYNVLVGDMSFVGPRPDVPGFADRLDGDDRVILTVRPGITGPATLEFRDEESLLNECSDPERYNRDVLFPKKVRINREYVENYRFLNDLKYIYQTLT